MPLASELLEFRPSPIHGTGGFARREITPNTRVLEYLGEKVSKEESLLRCAAGNYFIFHLDETWDLDGAVPDNPARLLNHSCAPNCEARWEEGRIWITTVREVRAGAELTFNYGYELENVQEHPCHCGAQSCVGFIVAEEFHDLLRRRQAHRQEASPE